MAVVHICGFGCGVTAPTGDTTHWTGVAGTPTILTGQDSWAQGRYAARCAASGAAVDYFRTISVAALQRVGRVRFRISTLPAAERQFVKLSTATGDFALTVDAGGVIRAGVVGGTFQVGPTVIAGQAFVAEWYANTTATTWTLDWRIDLVAQTQATRGSMTAGNMTSERFGAIEAATYTVDLTDVTIATIGVAAAQIEPDYPLGDGYVRVAYPIRDGTHNISTGAFRDSLGAAIIGATTTAWANVSEYPVGSDAHYIEQQTAAAAEYVEVILDARHDLHAPRAVAIVGKVAMASASTANSFVALLDTPDAVHQSIDVQPVAGDTTKQDFGITFPITGTSADEGFGGYGTYKHENERLRWGLSDDATPDVRLHGICYESEHPVTTVGISVVGSARHIITAGTTATWTTPVFTEDDDDTYVGISKDGVAVITPPAGWTAVGTMQVSGSAHSGVVYRRRAASDGATYDWTWAGAVNANLVGIVLRGCHTTPVLDDAQQANASDDVIPIPALTVSAQPMMLLAFGLAEEDNGLMSPPNGYTLQEFIGIGGTANTGVSASLAYKHHTGANPPAVQFSIGGASISVSFHIAVAGLDGNAFQKV